MKIHGLQKMTLLDFPGRVACTVFLGGCDLRCPFCHNAELIDGTAPAVMDGEELLAFLKKRQGLLEGVAVTGGEPLLRGGELVRLAEQIRELGYPLKLDTNGTHPEQLRQFLDIAAEHHPVARFPVDRQPAVLSFNRMDRGVVSDGQAFRQPVRQELRAAPDRIVEG